MVIKSSSVKSLAVFIDFENLALGFQGRNDRFEIKLVLTRLLEKGKIVAKKAYADWHRFSFYTASLHEAAIELVEIPRRAQTGKNSADIRLCVDAMDLAYSKEHIDTFVIVSGDSDFSPLVSKLKELGKHVIGLGMTNSTSNLLRDNCDEFIYYEDLTQTVMPDFTFKPELPDTKRKAFLLLAHAYNALRRDNREIIHSSTLKETMRRMKPSFNENYHGYRSFSQLLEDAQREGLIAIGTDQKSGTYVVTTMHVQVEPAQLPTQQRAAANETATNSHFTPHFKPAANHNNGDHRDERNSRSRRRRRSSRRPDDLNTQKPQENESATSDLPMVPLEADRTPVIKTADPVISDPIQVAGSPAEQSAAVAPVPAKRGWRPRLPRGRKAATPNDGSSATAGDGADTPDAQASHEDKTARGKK
jgi:uncharacterized protein (TIGR00288 family)